MTALALCGASLTGLFGVGARAGKTASAAVDYGFTIAQDSAAGMSGSAVSGVPLADSLMDVTGAVFDIAGSTQGLKPGETFSAVLAQPIDLNKRLEFDMEAWYWLKDANGTDINSGNWQAFHDKIGIANDLTSIGITVNRYPKSGGAVTDYSNNVIARSSSPIKPGGFQFTYAMFGANTVFANIPSREAIYTFYDATTGRQFATAPHASSTGPTGSGAAVINGDGRFGTMLSGRLGRNDDVLHHASAVMNQRGASKEYPGFHVTVEREGADLVITHRVWDNYNKNNTPVVMTTNIATMRVPAANLLLGDDSQYETRIGVVMSARNTPDFDYTFQPRAGIYNIEQPDDITKFEVSGATLPDGILRINEEGDLTGNAGEIYEPFDPVALGHIEMSSTTGGPHSVTYFTDNAAVVEIDTASGLPKIVDGVRSGQAVIYATSDEGDTCAYTVRVLLDTISPDFEMPDFGDIPLGRTSALPLPASTDEVWTSEADWPDALEFSAKVTPDGEISPTELKIQTGGANRLKPYFKPTAPGKHVVEYTVTNVLSEVSVTLSGELNVVADAHESQWSVAGLYLNSPLYPDDYLIAEELSANGVASSGRYGVASTNGGSARTYNYVYNTPITFAANQNLSFTTSFTLSAPGGAPPAGENRYAIFIGDSYYFDRGGADNYFSAGPRGIRLTFDVNGGKQLLAWRDGPNTGASADLKTWNSGVFYNAADLTAPEVQAAGDRIFGGHEFTVRISQIYVSEVKTYLIDVDGLQFAVPATEIDPDPANTATSSGKIKLAFGAISRNGILFADFSVKDIAFNSIAFPAASREVAANDTLSAYAPVSDNPADPPLVLTYEFIQPVTFAAIDASSGIVTLTGEAGGNVTVRATDQFGRAATYTLTVTGGELTITPPAETGVTYGAPPVELEISNRNFGFDWVSDNESVATVAVSGESGARVVTVTFVGRGTATITAGGSTNSASVTFTVKTASLALADSSGGTLELAYSQNMAIPAVTSSPTDAPVTAVSNGTSVVTVLDGRIYAVGAGTAVVRISAVDNPDAYVDVTVRVPYLDITLEEDAKTVRLGDEFDLSCDTFPAGGTLRFASDDAAVASVDASGKVTANGVGTATLTITIDGTTTQKTFAVTVCPLLTVTNGTADVTIKVDGAKHTIAYTVNPSDTTVTFLSSDTSIATVSAAGEVTALTAGNVTIYVSAGGAVVEVALTVEPKTVELTVTTKSVTLKAGETHQIDYSVKLPDAQAAFTSADDTVAAVGASGLITGVAAGSTVIYVSVGTTIIEVAVTVLAADSPEEGDGGGAAPGPSPGCGGAASGASAAAAIAALAAMLGLALIKKKASR
jgi:hypothetical protein